MSIKKHSDKKRIGSFGAMLQNIFHEKQQKEIKQEEDLREQVIKKEIEEQAIFYQQAFDEIKNHFEESIPSPNGQGKVSRGYTQIEGQKK